jgi:hypothetical protein
LGYYITTSKRIYCVLRSPHVDKDSLEHLKLEPTNEFRNSLQFRVPIFDLLSEADLPAGNILPNLFIRMSYLPAVTSVCFSVSTIKNFSIDFSKLMLKFLIILIIALAENH